MLLLAADTESTLQNIVQQEAELAQNADPGVIQSYLKGMVPNLLSFCIQLVVAAIVYFIGARLIHFIRTRVKKWLMRTDVDAGVIQFLDSVINIASYFILVCIILGLFGVQTASIMAVVGSAGLTAGLALQGSLSNFAGGVLILILKPFKVGDYIIEDTHGNEGTVMHISTVYTKLRTVDNKIIVIPNGNLANSSLTNLTQMDKRRIDLLVGVSYDADLKKAKEVLLKVAMDEPARLPDEEVNVFVSELLDSAVNIGCRVWVSTEDYWQAKWRMTENMKNALDKHKIEIPFQQIDVKIKN